MVARFLLVPGNTKMYSCLLLVVSAVCFPVQCTYLKRKSSIAICVRVYAVHSRHYSSIVRMSQFKILLFIHWRFKSIFFLVFPQPQQSMRNRKQFRQVFLATKPKTNVFLFSCTFSVALFGEFCKRFDDNTGSVLNVQIQMMPK